MIRSGVIKNLESWKDWPTVKEVISAIPTIYIYQDYNIKQKKGE
jgi:hypothetical protein